MNNKVNYPKWVSKLKRQLARAREEIEAKDKAVDFWINKANKQANEAKYWQNMCEIYKVSSNGYYEMISKKDEAVKSFRDCCKPIRKEPRIKAGISKEITPDCREASPSGEPLFICCSICKT